MLSLTETADITARLTYSKSAQPLILATIFDPEYPKFDELALVPLHEEPLLPADVQHVMDGYLNLYSDGTNRGSCKSSLFRLEIPFSSLAVAQSATCEPNPPMTIQSTDALRCSC